MHMDYEPPTPTLEAYQDQIEDELPMPTFEASPAEDDYINEHYENAPKAVTFKLIENPIRIAFSWYIHHFRSK